MPRRSFETKIEKIKKRSGKVVRFSPNKIRRAIKGAFKATGQKEAEEIDRLTRKVVADLEERFNSSIIPEVEQVQDIIETLLQEEGHDEVYKAFKLYRQLHHKLRRVSSLVDSDELTEKYLQKADWRVKENANMTYSLQGLNNHVASIISGNFWLNKIYSRQARKAHQSGDIHIHDLSSLSAYCTGWDLKDFLIKGFGGVPGKVHSSPAKHFSTALGQLVNFFYTVQGEVAGAVAVSNFDTYLAPFIRHDGLDYSEVKQNMQEFIFNMNVPTRVGFQTPFTNVSMDLHPTKMVGEESVIIGGEPQDKKYKDFQEEMDMLNKAFAEVMMEGDAQDRVFTFPIPTYSITKDFAWDNEDLEPIWEMTRKFGIPYFCLSKDTIVQEKHKGKITIGMVEKEDRLLTEQGYKKVDQVFHQSAKKIIKIGLANGEIIKATPIHRFPTGDGKIKKVEELTLKDKLVLNQSKQIVLKSKIVLEERDESNFIFWVLNGNSLEKKNLTDLRKGDKVFLETQAEFAGKTDISNFSFEESVFANNTKKINVPKKLNGKLSRLLGYLVGDGSYTGKGRQLPVVTFTNQEEAILEDFERIITDLFGTSLKIRKRNVGKNGETKTLSISSVILRDFLQFLGLDYKQASEKRIPSLIFQTTEENVAQFLRGLFDADGSVGKKGNIVFVSANFNLVKEVWYLLFKLGIFARFVRLSGARTEGYGKLYILGKHAVNFKDKIGFISPHKEKRLREIKTNKPCLGSYSGLSGLLKKLLPEERSALSGKMLGLWEKVHYRHRAKLTRQDLQLILENGLDSKKAGRTIKFICERNLFGDVVQDLKLRKQEQLAIKSLATIDGDFSVVDVSIDSPSHLFMIGSGVLTHNSNFVNSDMDPDDVRSMCCRLRLENKELRRRGGLFSANPLTGCYDEKTEILTSEGWVSFPKLTKEHQVYTLTENDEIETHQPQKLFKYDWEGELYRFKARSLDLLVTPNHRMVVDTTNGARKFVEAQDFVPNTHRIPKKGNWQGEKKKWFTLPREPLKIKMNDWLAFFGIWLAEGSCDNDNIAKDHGYRVNITQKKPHTRQKIKKLLERLPFNCRMTDNGFVICNKQLWTYLKQFGKCYGKYIPDEFKNLSKEQLKTLFDWLVEGDGHIRKTSGQVNYWTSSKRLADDVQEIILKLGYTATITSRKGRTTHIRNREISSDRPIYNVGLLKSKHHRLRKRNISREFYKGQVYCCEVENNTVLVRRNGRVAWCGNSVGVVTVNMPRIGWRAKNETTSEGRAQQRFFTILGELMDVAKNSLMDKRAAVEKFTEKGLYPYCRHYLQDIKERNDVYWRNHFNTIGLNGMNEAMVNMLGKNIATEEGKAFALEVMEYMRKKLLTYQQETGEMFNLEATPAEGTTYRFARLDKEQYPEIACANEKAYQENDAAPYYTNSTHLPVDYTTDIFEALDHQDELQCLYSGGCIEEGNKVLTDKGALPIERIVRDFSHLKPIKVLSYNSENKKSEWDEIVKAVTVDVDPEDKVRVEGERGFDVVTSDWHPFFVLEKKKITSSCLICGKKVKNAKAFAAHLRYHPDCKEEYSSLFKYEVIEKRADELERGDYVLQNNNNLWRNKGNISKELMWLIGFFIGDGCLSEYTDNRGGNNLLKHKIRFFSEHKKAMVHARNIINREFNCNISVIKNDTRSDRLRELSTSKQSVIDFFLDKGFESGEKVYRIGVPQAVKENLDKENVFALLSGLMDSDGHIDKKSGDFEYYTVSSKLADDILEVFSVAGVMISKTKKVVQRENEQDIWRLRIPGYEMTRLKEKLTNSFYKERISETVSLRKRRHLPVVRIQKITRVRREEDRPFYDLMTKKHHNYLAGKNTFVFIHNTVLHGFLGESLPDTESVKNLVRKVAKNYELPYFSVTPTFSICPKHGYLKGEWEYCPKCDEEIGYQEK